MPRYRADFAGQEPFEIARALAHGRSAATLTSHANESARGFHHAGLPMTAKFLAAAILAARSSWRCRGPPCQLGQTVHGECGGTRRLAYRVTPACSRIGGRLGGGKNFRLPL